MISYFIHDHGCKNKGQKNRECTDDRFWSNLYVSCSQQHNARGDHRPVPNHGLYVDSNSVDAYCDRIDHNTNTCKQCVSCQIRAKTYNGADIVSVSEKLGHSETSVTLDVYSHVNKKAQKRANQILSQALYTPQNGSKMQA